jgi:hypothetical protein
MERWGFLGSFCGLLRPLELKEIQKSGSKASECLNFLLYSATAHCTIEVNFLLNSATAHCTIEVNFLLYSATAHCTIEVAFRTKKSCFIATCQDANLGSPSCLCIWHLELLPRRYSGRRKCDIHLSPPFRAEMITGEKP